MKKRILAMLLVLCTVLVSVPVFALPAIAAPAPRYEYSTSFDSSKYPVNGVYPDPAWGVYQYPASEAGAAFGPFATQAGLVCEKSYWADNDLSRAVAGPAWSYGWNQRVHLVMKPSTNGGWSVFAEPNQIGVSEAAAAAVRYTVEKSGVVDINIDRLANITSQSAGMFEYSVMVNGVSKWSKTVEMVNGSVMGDILVDTMPDELKGIKVIAGDLIEFTIRFWRPGAAEAVTWQGSGSVFQGTVNYAEVFYSTAFNASSNFPVVNADGTVTYKGGFSAVGFRKGANGFDFSNYASALTMNAQSALWNYAGGQVGIAHNYAATDPSAVNWNQRAHMVIKGFNQNFFANDGEIVVTQSMAGGVRYEVEKRGTVNIDFTKIGNTLAKSGGLSNFVYGVYKNGEKIWEAKGADWVAAGQANLSYKTGVPVATDLKVKIGDIIDFVVYGVNPGADLWGQSGGNILFPAITYTSVIEIAHSSSFNGLTGMPTVAGGVVTPAGAWAPMAYTKALGYNDISKAHAMNVSNNLIINTGTFAIANDWPGGDIAGWRNKASLTIKATHVEGTDNAKCFHTPGAFNVTTEQSAGVRYTAEKTGYIELILDKIGNVVDDETVIGQGANQSKPCSDENFRYGVFLNGEMIWPVAGGTLADTAPLSEATLSEVVVAENLKVFVGDVIDIICEAEGAKEKVNQWQGAGNVMFATVNYTQVNEYSFAFNGSTNLPTLVEDAEGNRIVSYYGNFYPIAYDYDKDAKSFHYDDPTKALLMDAASSINPTSNPLAAIAPKNSSGGGTTRCLMVLEACHANYWRELGQINVTGQMSGGIRYVADETGTIDIDLSRLGNNVPDGALADAAKGVSKMTFYVYVNGEEVWSLKGSVLAEEFAKKAYGDEYQPGQMKAAGLKLNVPVDTGIDVVLGDTIDFIVEGTGISETSPWEGAGNIMFPIVTYTNVIPKATTSANVSMSSNFAINAKMTLPEEMLYDIIDFGMLVNEKEFPLVQESDTVFAANNVLKAYVQDLKSESVTLQPYYTYLDDEAGEVTIWGNEVTANIYEMLEAYRDGEDAAAAALADVLIGKRGYVEAAEAYFDALLSEEGFSNAVVPEEEEEDLSGILVPNPSQPIIIENPESIVDFTGVSLILNNALALKFHLALPEDADIENYSLVAVDPITLSEGLDSFGGILPAGALATPLREYNAFDDGNAVAYFGTTFENMDRLYAFYIADETGMPISDMIFYNPLTYATNMARDAEVGIVCRALLELNNAINIYTGAIANR